MQIAGQGGAAGPRLGLYDTFTSVLANEGAKGLFKGLSPALLRQASYSSIRVGIYEPLKAFVSGDTGDGQKVLTMSYGQKVLAGGASGALGILIANPTELVKIRMQADKAGTRYTGTIDAFSKIVRNEGPLGLWAGAMPNMQRAFIVNAMELGTYDHAKAILVQDYQMKADSVLTHTIASFVAGFFATVACNPVDTIKNRLMNQVLVLDYCMDHGVVHHQSAQPSRVHHHRKPGQNVCTRVWLIAPSRQFVKRGQWRCTRYFSSFLSYKTQFRFFS
jgi:hypothetical protein